METPRRWVVATGNSGKLAEIRVLLAASEIEIVSQGDLGIEGAEETAVSFVENALIKARHAARCSGLPAIADDSGLVVDALDGEPGVYSARYAGPDANSAANITKLLKALEGIPATARTARFHCVVVALLSPADPTPLVVHGCWEGHIAEKPSGRGGFGYDPVFIDPRLGVSAAEMTPAAKNEASHRAIALRKLLALLDGEPAGC